MKGCDASAAIRGSFQRRDAPSWIIATAIAEVSPTGPDRRLNDSITEEHELDHLAEKQRVCLPFLLLLLLFNDGSMDNSLIIPDQPAL